MIRKALSALLAAVAIALAAPAFASGLDGPFAFPDRSQPVVVGGVTTYPVLLAGVHYICTPAVFAANATLLGPYKDASQVNLDNVYAGDDPAQPTMTVALTFPDLAAANKAVVLLAPPRA